MILLCQEKRSRREMQENNRLKQNADAKDESGNKIKVW